VQAEIEMSRYCIVFRILNYVEQTNLREFNFWSSRCIIIIIIINHFYCPTNALKYIKLRG